MTETETAAPPGVTRWRRKATEVEAVQWDGSDETFALIAEWGGEPERPEDDEEVADSAIWVRTDRSAPTQAGVELGWWLIRQPGQPPCLLPADAFAAEHEVPDDTTPVTRGDLAAASLAADRARETIAMLGEDLLRQRARAQRAEAELAKAVAGERERIAGLLDEAAAAIMAKAVELVSEGDEANGLPKVQMAASVGLAASLVRGKVPQQVSDLLPPGMLPGSAPESAP